MSEGDDRRCGAEMAPSGVDVTLIEEMRRMSPGSSLVCDAGIINRMNRPKVTYRRCLVSFFDILGFRELVKTRSADDLGELVGLFQKTAEIGDQTARVFEAQSFQFSDCAVRTVPVDSEANTQYPVGILFLEVLSIVHAALEMANRGILVRGGLTIGEAHFSGTMLFGPAMIRAYELESRVAIYPRVVIDPVLIEALKRDPLLKKDTNRVSHEVSELLKLRRRPVAKRTGIMSSMLAGPAGPQPIGGGRLLSWLAGAGRRTTPTRLRPQTGTTRTRQCPAADSSSKDLGTSRPPTRQDVPRSAPSA